MKVERSIEELGRAAAARTTVYNFLSRSFSREVDSQFLGVIMDIQPTLSVLARSAENDDMKKGADLLREFLEQSKKNYQAHKEEFLTRLAAEYAALFLNVGPKPVFLVESVYLSKRHILYEEPYFEISKAYSLLGFEKAKDFSEPEDHIAVELEFMAKLSERTSENIAKENLDHAAKYVNLQREFLEYHLTKWVPTLTDRLKEATDNLLYTALAHLTRGFIAQDAYFVAHAYGKLTEKEPWKS
jgi:TorA maturation chaperone TorD